MRIGEKTGEDSGRFLGLVRSVSRKQQQWLRRNSIRQGRSEEESANQRTLTSIVLRRIRAFIRSSMSHVIECVMYLIHNLEDTWIGELSCHMWEEIICRQIDDRYVHIVVML